jgi:Integrase core domain
MVHAVLARHHLPRRWELDRPTGLVVRYQRQRPGELVHVDIKPQGRIPAGVGTGCWAAAKAAPTGTAATAWAMTICMWRSMTAPAWPRWRPPTAKTALPRPRSPAVPGLVGPARDPGRAGTDRQRLGYRSQAFQQVLAQAGAQHRRTRPYRPPTNGKAERFNPTLATEWSYARLYASNQARLDALPGWLHHYNHHRPYTALDGSSPMQLLNNVPENHT